MTKEHYYDMCEMLDSTPVESEIPVDYDDLNLDVQQGLEIYNMLQDQWDTMNGNYMGKNYSGALDIMELFEVEDRKTTFNLLRKIDEYRSKAIKLKNPAPSNTKNVPQ